MPREVLTLPSIKFSSYSAKSTHTTSSPSSVPTVNDMRATSSTNHSSSSSSRTDKPKHAAAMLNGDNALAEKQEMVTLQEEKKGEKRSTANYAFPNSETITSLIKKQKTALYTKKLKGLIHGSSNDSRRGNGSSGATAAKSKLTSAPKPQQKLSTSQKRATERLRQRKAQRNKAWTRPARRDVGSKG